MVTIVITMVIYGHYSYYYGHYSYYYGYLWSL